MDVLGLGECMIQMDADTTLSDSVVFFRQVGGDVYNTLVTLSRLGSQSGFVTNVASDGFGEVLLRHFKANEIDMRYVRQLQSGRNGVYFTSVLPDGGHEFVYYRDRSAASRLMPEQIDEAMIAQARMVYATGVTQAISASARRAVLKAFQMAKRLGVTVAFDPNYRPNLWNHQDDALAAFIEVMPYVDIVMPSLEDMAQLFGERSPDKILEYFRLREVPLVVLKQGAEGAIIGFKNQSVHVPAAQPAMVADTIGAGDAFNGAFLHGILQQESLLTCGQWGAQTAAFSLEKPGPIQGLPTWMQLSTSIREAESVI